MWKNSILGASVTISESIWRAECMECAGPVYRGYCWREIRKNLPDGLQMQETRPVEGMKRWRQVLHSRNSECGMHECMGKKKKETRH
jgi:hypothetical protein